MSNRIRSVLVSTGRMDPVETEVWITVYPERLTPTTQVRGRLLGPRCAWASTVEVAYPLREQSRAYEATGTPQITCRVLIPEASWWDPESPLLYEAPLELWQDGMCCDETLLRHAVRQCQLGPRGLRWNGRLTELHGVACDHLTMSDALELRRAGRNTLLVPVGADTAGVWDAADQFGFLVLGRISRRDDFNGLPALTEHVSYLGCVMEREALCWPDLLFGGVTALGGSNQNLVGVELEQPPAEPLPREVSFVFCSEAALPSLAEVPLPKLVRRQGGSATALPDVLGWIAE